MYTWSLNICHFFRYRFIDFLSSFSLRSCAHLLTIQKLFARHTARIIRYDVIIFTLSPCLFIKISRRLYTFIVFEIMLDGSYCSTLWYPFFYTCSGNWSDFCLVIYLLLTSLLLLYKRVHPVLHRVFGDHHQYWCARNTRAHASIYACNNIDSIYR